MENQPLISVIIPVYNVESYLRECVESVINQTYENLEIILVNDGSTDRSGDICDYYTDERIKVIHKELSLHDFRMTPHSDRRTNLIFDVVAPSDLKISDDEITFVTGKNTIEEAITKGEAMLAAIAE